MTARLRSVGALLAVAALLLFVEAVQQRQTGELSPQSRINAHFAERPSLLSALRLYPRYWPPLYPTLLWLAARAGVTPDRVNEVFFLLTVVLVGVYAAVHLPTVHWLLPVLVFAVGHYNYVNMYQHISETLFAFLSLAVLFLLLRYRRDRGGRALALLALAGAASAATKYMALFWSVPLAALHLALGRPAALRRRLAHALVFLLVGVAPVGVWIAIAWTESGYLSGSDRFAPRPFQELTTFDKNIVFTAKTLLIDFASLEKYASHAVVNAPYQPSAWEIVVVAVAALAAAVTVWALLARRTEAERSANGAAARLTAEFLAAYLAVTIALWTVGNNDPIYTRFLYPAYPLLVLVGFHAYAIVKARPASPWARLPFRLLYSLLLLTHSVRDYHAVALPLR